jgi:hypothetical protein
MLTIQVVPEYSAILNLPNELIIPLNAHHRSICRFPSSKDSSYVLVEAAIKEIAMQTGSGSDSLREISSLFFSWV